MNRDIIAQMSDQIIRLETQLSEMAVLARQMMEKEQNKQQKSKESRFEKDLTANEKIEE